MSSVVRRPRRVVHRGALGPLHRDPSLHDPGLRGQCKGNREYQGRTFYTFHLLRPSSRSRNPLRPSFHLHTGQTSTDSLLHRRDPHRRVPGEYPHPPVMPGHLSHPTILVPPLTPPGTPMSLHPSLVHLSPRDPTTHGTTKPCGQEGDLKSSPGHSRCS